MFYAQSTSTVISGGNQKQKRNEKKKKKKKTEEKKTFNGSQFRTLYYLNIHNSRFSQLVEQNRFLHKGKNILHAG